MNSTEYRTRALKMESPLNDLHLTKGRLLPALASMSISGDSIDLLKRLGFYTKKPDIDLHRKKVIAGLADIREAVQHSDKFDTSHLDPRLVHGILGYCSEAAELATELMNAMTQRRPIDVQNIVEELGDGDWYQNLIHDALGITQEQVWAGNLAKLETRYASGANPQATAHDPANRDKAAELRAMDAAAASAADGDPGARRDSVFSSVAIDPQRVSVHDDQHTYKLQKGQLRDHPKGKWCGVMAETLPTENTVQLVFHKIGMKPFSVELYADDMPIGTTIDRVTRELRQQGAPLDDLYLYFVVDQDQRYGFAVSQSPIVGVVDTKASAAAATTGQIVGEEVASNDEATAEIDLGGDGLDDLILLDADDAVEAEVEVEPPSPKEAAKRLMDTVFKSILGQTNTTDLTKLAAERAGARIREIFQATRGGPGYDQGLEMFGMTRVVVDSGATGTLVEKAIELSGKNGPIIAIIEDPALTGQFQKRGFVICQTPKIISNLLDRLSRLGQAA